jgi:hypothetical protein
MLLLTSFSQAFHSLSLIRHRPLIKKNNIVKKNSFVKLKSHFSVISSKITDKNILKKTLLEINKDFDIYDGPLIINSYNNNKIKVDLAIKQDNFYDIGFVLEDNVYNMVTDLQFWDQTVPPNVFMERLIKQYTINSIIDTCTEEGFYTEHITTDMETGFTEIVVSRYKDK